MFAELVTACRLAGIPTKRSPSAVNAHTEGVVRAPSAFSITCQEIRLFEKAYKNLFEAKIPYSLVGLSKHLFPERYANRKNPGKLTEVTFDGFVTR